MNENEDLKDKVKYLVGKDKISDTIFQPYSDILIDFLNDLSKQIKLNKKSFEYPDVLTFAFWCRKGNILKLKKEFIDEKKRLGLGTIFHIAPSNVPINFAFSFVFGILSGNSNIVRVPSKNFAQIEIICDSLNIILNKKKYYEIKQMIAFVRYDRDDYITAEFSKNCNGRIIWGGDNTIKSIRKLAIPVRCVDIAFADRYSFCIMDGSKISILSEQELLNLAEKFYNDTFLIDQNACSSPHLLVWLNKTDDKIKEIFWNALQKVTSKKYKLEDVSAVDKYNKLCNDAIVNKEISYFKHHKNLIYRIGLKNLPINIDTLRGKWGYFYEFETDDINKIAFIVNSKYQTLTYFGTDKNILTDFVMKNKLSGIDRIVPIGQALDIGIIWDGYDIVNTLSRIIDVK